jgi:hypothetical protein
MAKKASAASKRQRSMSDEHKAALAEGREQGRVVRQYLEALESHRPKRGRKRTPGTITKRLGVIEDQLAGADPLSRLHLVQKKMDLKRRGELSASSPSPEGRGDWAGAIGLSAVRPEADGPQPCSVLS